MAPCILPSEMHGDTYLRGLMREDVIRGSACPKKVPTVAVPLSALSWAGSPRNGIAHHIHLHSLRALLTSTEGSPDSCLLSQLDPHQSSPLGAPSFLSSLGKTQVSQPPFSFLYSCWEQWGPRAMKTLFSCFLKERGRPRASAFPFSVGFLQSDTPEGHLALLSCVL